MKRAPIGQVLCCAMARDVYKRQTYMLAMYIYDTAFKYQDMGYAAAMSWLMLVLIIVLTVVIFKFSSMWVFYETEVKGEKP